MDTADFFTKEESDARYAQGPGMVAPIPLSSFPNGADDEPLTTIAGVGTLSVGCALGNVPITLTNTSSVTETVTLGSSYTRRNNTGGDPDTYTVAPGGSYDDSEVDSHDAVQMVIAGAKVATVLLATHLEPSDNCDLYGDIYVG